MKDRKDAVYFVAFLHDFYCDFVVLLKKTGRPGKYGIVGNPWAETKVYERTVRERPEMSMGNQSELRHCIEQVRLRNRSDAVAIFTKTCFVNLTL